MKKKNELYTPLKLIQDITAKYPKCWEQVETLRYAAMYEPESGIDWDISICYIPIGGAQACVSNKLILDINSDEIQDAQRIAALAPWRQYKAAYRFNEDLMNLLYTQSADIKIPIEIIDKMPYPCIYIETPVDSYMQGFFAHQEYDVNTNERELRFLIVKPNGYSYGLPVHILPGKTIIDGIEKTFEISHENVLKYLQTPILADGEEVEKDKMKTIELINRMMQLFLYVCSENAEITENPIQRNIFRQGQSVKDVYREVKKWDVGVKIGSLIKTSRKMESTKDSNHLAIPGSAKRPHTRRGHWHHYWTGEGGSNLILKWVAPTFINAEFIDENNNDIPVNVIEFKPKNSI